MAQKIKTTGARSPGRTTPRKTPRETSHSPHGAQGSRRPSPATAAPREGASRTNDNWLYGRHPVAAALENPRRKIQRLLATTDVAKDLHASASVTHVEIVTRRDLDDLLPDGAVHQGCALLAAPTAALSLEDILEDVDENAIVVLLDQVSDPHNVGAVLRSAAVFGAAAVIAPARGAPPATGVLAKAASGALEKVPLLAVTNLARAMETLKEHNFWCIGLDGGGDSTLANAPFQGRVALVLGAEGQGLRRLTRKNCDLLATIPAAGPFATLNVSNAAAVALYEIFRRKAD